MNMVPMIRNILGGFLFSGDDVYKKVRVLSGGERTRLAVARMLLRPSNALLLDEPTNHLDLDSKDVLLDALVDYGGTLIFVSHDRYFVERLATKIIEINGSGDAVMYPGTYAEFLYRKEHGDRPAESLAPHHKAGGQRPKASAEHDRSAKASAEQKRSVKAPGDQNRNAKASSERAPVLNASTDTSATAPADRSPEANSRRKEAAGCRRPEEIARAAGSTDPRRPDGSPDRGVRGGDARDRGPDGRARLLRRPRRRPSRSSTSIRPDVAASATSCTNGKSSSPPPTSPPKPDKIVIRLQ